MGCGLPTAQPSSAAAGVPATSPEVVKSVMASGLSAEENQMVDSISDCARFPEVASQHCRNSREKCDRPDRSHLLKESCPFVRFTASEWEDKVRSEEKLLLVGRFARQRPSLDLIRARMKQILRLEGEVQIGSLDRRSILLRFDLEDDCKRSWMRNQVVIEGSRL